MITVIIPSYNSQGTIRGCLDSVLNQSYGDRYEVILVDSSSDNTPQIVTMEYPQVKLIHLERKTDPGAARNIGIQEARGDVIAFIDSDCQAGSDWLEKIAAAHESSYRIVGGAVLNDNPEGDLVGWAGYLAEFREFMLGHPKREVGHIPTCNISYKRAIFAVHGLFEGEYYPQEDLVYNYRLSRNGEKILLDPGIQIRHCHRSDFLDFLRHQRKIGLTTARVLKMLPLPGSFIARHPFPGLLLVPVLPVMKFIKTVIVFVRYQPKVILKRPAVLFLFALGLAEWAIGFIQGMHGEFKTIPLQHTHTRKYR